MNISKAEKLKIKLLFEDIESKIPQMHSNHFMTQGYICQEGIWWRYYTEFDFMAGKHYNLYNQDGEIAWGDNLLYGDIYTIDLQKISKLKYLFNMCFCSYKQDPKTINENY